MKEDTPIRVLIAEDEALLARALADNMQRLWPQMQLIGIASDGFDAVTQALILQPDVLFFDIKMPGQSGLDAACELTDQWPENQTLPLLVFVTAYDNHAIQAFEQAAVDYLLKPVNEERLCQTIARLQERLKNRTAAANAEAIMTQTLTQLRAITPKTVPAPTAPEPLRMIRATVGNQIRLIPVDDIIYFSAIDKYLNVATVDGEVLIRISLKELLVQLDPQQFWQVHRSTIVRVDAIRSAQREANGKLFLNLHQRPERLAVSRLFAHLFRPRQT